MSETVDRRWSDADAPDLAGILAWMEGRPDAPIGHDLDAAAAQLRTLIAATGTHTSELARLRAKVAEQIDLLPRGPLSATPPETAGGGQDG